MCSSNMFAVYHGPGTALAAGETVPNKAKFCPHGAYLFSGGEKTGKRSGTDTCYQKNIKLGEKTYFSAKNSLTGNQTSDKTKLFKILNTLLENELYEN